VRIPVVVRVPAILEAGAAVAVEGALRPDDVLRTAVTLTKPGAVRFSGVAHSSAAPGSTLSVGGQVRTPRGDSVSLFRVSSSSRVAALEGTTEVLPAGTYEVLVVAYPGASASFAGDVRITGAVLPAPARVVAARVAGDAVTLAVAVDDDLRFDAAELTLYGRRVEAALTRGQHEGRESFFGSVPLTEPLGEESTGLLAVEQDAIDGRFESVLAMEATFFSAGAVKGRTWLDLVPPGASLTGAFAAPLQLGSTAGSFELLLYPNVVDWPSFRTQTLRARVGLPFATPVAASVAIVVTLTAGQETQLVLPTTGATPGSYGELVLRRAGLDVARVPVEL
jgi:hypothetical protein